MAEIGRWNNHIFEVSPTVMRSFDDLTIVGKADTEEKTAGTQKYLSYKNGGAISVTMTILLSKFLGCDVREEALAFVNEARKGSRDYLYLDGKKLVTCPLMLTNAEVSQTEIAAGGQWVYAEVKVTFKQSDKCDGEAGGSSSSGGSGKSGSKKSGSGSSGSSAGILDTALNVTGKFLSGVVTGLKALTGDKAATKSAQDYIKSQVQKVAKAKSASKVTTGGGTKMRATK